MIKKINKNTELKGVRYRLKKDASKPVFYKDIVEDVIYNIVPEKDGKGKGIISATMRGSSIISALNRLTEERMNELARELKAYYIVEGSFDNLKIPEDYTIDFDVHKIFKIITSRPVVYSKMDNINNRNYMFRSKFTAYFHEEDLKFYLNNFYKRDWKFLENSGIITRDEYDSIFKRSTHAFVKNLTKVDSLSVDNNRVHISNTIKTNLNMLSTLIKEHKNIFKVFHGKAGTGKSTKVARIIKDKKPDSVAIVSLSNTIGIMLKNKIDKLVKDPSVKVEYNSIIKATHIPVRKKDVIIIDEFGQWGFAEIDLLIDLLSNNKNAEFYLMGDVRQIPTFLSGGSLLYSIIEHMPQFCKELKTAYRFKNANCIEMEKNIDDLLIDNKISFPVFADEAETENDVLKRFDFDVVICGTNKNVNKMNRRMFYNKFKTDVVLKNMMSAFKNNNVSIDVYKTLLKVKNKEVELLTNTSEKTNLTLGSFGQNYNGTIQLNRNERVTVKYTGSTIEMLFKAQEIKEVITLKRSGSKASLKRLSTYDEKALEIFFDKFNLGYALTVNKAQGLEWNNVLVYLTRNDFNLLNKNAMYVAISRGLNNLIVCSNNLEREKFISNLTLSDMILDENRYFNNFEEAELV